MEDANIWKRYPEIWNEALGISADSGNWQLQQQQVYSLFHTYIHKLPN